MGIVITIVSGIVVVSVIAVIGDYLTKARQAAPAVDTAELRGLRDRVEALEREAAERDSRIAQIEGDVAFTTRLLEGKRDNAT